MYYRCLELSIFTINKQDKVKQCIDYNVSRVFGKREIYFSFFCCRWRSDTRQIHKEWKIRVTQINMSNNIIFGVKFVLDNAHKSLIKWIYELLDPNLRIEKVMYVWKITSLHSQFCSAQSYAVALCFQVNKTFFDLRFVWV